MFSRLSAVKKILLVEHNCSPDLSLPTALLKRKSETHLPKKSPVFSPVELRATLSLLGDDLHITHKLAVLMMIHGGLRRDEATHLLWGDIEVFATHLVVKVR